MQVKLQRYSNLFKRSRREHGLEIAGGGRFLILTRRGHPNLMIELFVGVVLPGIPSCSFPPYDGSVGISFTGALPGVSCLFRYHTLGGRKFIRYNLIVSVNALAVDPAPQCLLFRALP